MSLFEQLYERLFQNQSTEAPLIFETLTRSEQYQSDYETWLASNLSATRLRDIYSAFELKKQGVLQNPEVHILNSSMANGLAISYDEYFEKNEFSYLMDLIRTQALQLGYKQANSDRIIKEKNRLSETTEKHYLKPQISGEPPFDQKYGNILIEHVKINDVSSYLKISANTYQDHKYQKALDFNELVSQLLN